MKLKYFLVFLLGILILSVAAVSAEDNATDGILQTQDSDFLSENATGNTFSDIQKAIDDAQENDTLTLEGNYTGSGVEIKIDKAITIQSSTNSVLDAKSNSRIFNITANNVVLKNLIFVNGKSTEGGAIYASGNLTVENCNFSNNYAFNKVQTWFGDGDIKGYMNDGKGGAIFAKASLTCIDSYFTGNYAKDPKAKYKELFFENYGKGGVIYCGYYDYEEDEDYGMIRVSRPGGPLNIINCSLNNSYDLIHALGIITIINSQFDSNTGSLIYSQGRVSVFKSNFTKNACEYSYFDNLISCGANSSFVDSKFMENTKYHEGTVLTEDNATFVNCYFENNTAYFGGAIHTYSASICNSTFMNNQHCYYNEYDETSQGGAIYFIDCLSVENSIFKDNQAQFGAAIFSQPWASDFSNLTIVNSTFENNVESAVVSQGEVTVINGSQKTTRKAKLVVLDDNLNDTKLINVDFKSKFVSYYNTGEKYIVKLTFVNSKKPVDGFGVRIIAYKNNKKVKSFFARSNKEGKSIFKKLSTLAAGTYDIKIISDDLDSLFSYSAKITIKKVAANVKAPKVTAKYKKTKYFKVTVKDKRTKKAIGKVQLKVKVYTGKKYKTYKIKTNKKGLAKLNTKKLSKGKHKVVISSVDKNYKLSAKSTIQIK